MLVLYLPFTLFSLGCVVLEMFAGRRPWDSEEAIQAMFKVNSSGSGCPLPFASI